MIASVYGPHQDILVHYYGFIVMRQNVAEGIWYVAGGVQDGRMVLESLPGPTTYVYQVWAVRGYQSPVQQVQIRCTTTMVALGARK